MSNGFRWGVFRTSLDPVVGSEQGGERPVLVVSNEDFNQAMPVLTVLPLTSWRPGRRIYPNEVLLPQNAAGQPRDSVILVYQVRSISKNRLGHCYGYVVDTELQARILEAVKIHFDIED